MKAAASTIPSRRRGTVLHVVVALALGGVLGVLGGGLGWQVGAALHARRRGTGVLRDVMVVSGLYWGVASGVMWLGWILFLGTMGPVSTSGLIFGLQELVAVWAVAAVTATVVVAVVKVSTIRRRRPA